VEDGTKAKGKTPTPRHTQSIVRTSYSEGRKYVPASEGREDMPAQRRQRVRPSSAKAEQQCEPEMRAKMRAKAEE
jgi:hypothetical protein